MTNQLHEVAQEMYLSGIERVIHNQRPYYGMNGGLLWLDRNCPQEELARQKALFLASYVEAQGNKDYARMLRRESPSTLNLVFARKLHEKGAAQKFERLRQEYQTQEVKIGAFRLLLADSEEMFTEHEMLNAILDEFDTKPRYFLQELDDYVEEMRFDHEQMDESTIMFEQYLQSIAAYAIARKFSQEKTPNSSVMIESQRTSPAEILSEYLIRLQIKMNPKLGELFDRKRERIVNCAHQALQHRGLDEFCLKEGILSNITNPPMYRKEQRTLPASARLH